MTSIQMPQLGETIVEGTILKWLKQEGDAVAADEPLFEISTDKVDTEVPSPVAGTVTKLLVAEGATVPVGTAVMEIDDGTAAVAGNGARRPGRRNGADGCGRRGSDGRRSRKRRGVGSRRPPPPRRARRSQRPPAPGPTRRRPRCRIGGRGRRSCRRSCVGSRGSAGSISPRSRARVRAAGSRRPTCWRPPAEPLPRRRPRRGRAGPARCTRPRWPRCRRRRRCRAGEGEDVEPMSHIRKAIATHMLASVNQTARAWTMVEVNVERLVRLRTTAKDGFLEKLRREAHLPADGHARDRRRAPRVSRS